MYWQTRNGMALSFALRLSRRGRGGRSGRGGLNVHCVGSYHSNWILFLSCFCVSLVLILHVFHVRRVYRGLFFFSLVLILHIPAYLGIKGDQFFTDFKKNLALVLRTNWCTTICITCLILHEIECIKFVCSEFVLVLVQIDLIQFEFSNCIRSICTKTNKNSLHTNLIHSILRKNWTILHKIGQVI